MKDDMNGPSDLTEEEITEVLEGMVAKGLLERIVDNGEVKYKLTELGLAARSHMESDPKTRN